MINGRAVASFQHDSTWSEDVQTRFRSAVYYLHVHVSGHDPINHLRELVVPMIKKRQTITAQQWGCLKIACNKIVHVSIDGVGYEEMPTLVKNLLLILDYGLRPGASLRFVSRDPVKQRQYGASSRAATDEFLARIGEVCRSLNDVISEWRAEHGDPKRPLKLDESARVLSSNRSVHPLIGGNSTNVEMRITSHDRDVDACRYEFRPVDPIGWVMVNGGSSKDRFADDLMSSTWP